MNTKDDGGPAFPRSPHSGEASDDGMSLRRYFAAKALQGTLANSAYHDDSPQALAKWAYEMADAMIAEGAK
jgi:hypothetical protein